MRRRASLGSSSAGYSGAFNAADKSGFCACVGEPGRTHEALAVSFGFRVNLHALSPK